MLELNKFVPALLLICFITSLLMTGIIWFIQVVHYRVFKYSAEDKSHRLFTKNIRRTKHVLYPIMTTELISTAILVFMPLPEQIAFFIYISALFLLIIWISTLMIQFPCLQKMKKGYDHKLMLFLRKTNWIRTCSWTLRSLALLIAFIYLFYPIPA